MVAVNPEQFAGALALEVRKLGKIPLGEMFGVSAAAGREGEILFREGGADAQTEGVFEKPD